MTTSTITPTAWERTTVRQRALHTLDQTIRDDPSALSDAVRTARSEGFDSLDDLLLAAHLQWMRTHDAQIDALLERGVYGDQAAFDAAWFETARLLDGTARLLDHHADHPAIVRAHAQHVRRTRAMLAVDLPSTFAVPQPKTRPRRRGLLCRLPKVRFA